MAATTTSQLLSDLTSTVGAIRNQDWMTAGMDAGGTSLDALGAVTSPLSAIAGAGFGFVLPLVSFLDEPLHQLEGDPGSVTSGSQGMESAGRSVGSLADSYQQAAGTQTSGWSGDAADGYQDLGNTMTAGISAIGQAGTAVASAATGAGAAVSQTTQQVSQLISEVAGKIITTLTQAFASAQATFGASIVAAIPRVVQTAVQYGQQILGTMRTLLSSSQNLAGLVQSVLKAVDAVDQVLQQLLPSTGADSGASPAQPGHGETGRAQGQPAEADVSAPADVPVMMTRTA